MLCLFGRPTLTTASGDRINLSPSGWRLLAVMAVAPSGGVARTELIELVIPTAKLSTLRKLVWSVRKALDIAGLDLIDGSGSDLRLSNEIYCDARDLRSIRPQRALHDIYRGPFFEMGSTFQHRPWMAWLDQQREELLAFYVSRASTVLASVDVDRSTKVQEARHLLRQVPNHAGATQVLMLEGARTTDSKDVLHRFADLRTSLKTAGEVPDRCTTDLLYRLVGASQRQLGTERKSEVMALPTIYVSAPSGVAQSKTARVVRSLLTDMTIGLCRASLFRVIGSDPPQPSDTGPSAERAISSPRSYVVVSSVLDHVVGRQIVFTLMSLPRKEILWTEKIEAAADLNVDAYNLLTAGVLRSLVQRIKDVEVEAFRLDADPSAYASYLAGYSSLTSLDLAKLRKGRHHLQRSMSQSPDFAPTTSALARSYQLEYLVTGRGEQGLLRIAREYSLHAIASDPLEARGLKALGFCDLYEKRFDEALENYIKAEQLNRNYADLVAEHANCLLHCGLLEQALEKIEYAMRLNPQFGDMYRWTKASACFLLTRYSDVLEVIGQMQDREPVFKLLAATHALIGNRDEARICRMKAMEIYPTTTIEGWTNIVALKDPRHVQHYTEGLAKAGFV